MLAAVTRLHRCWHAPGEKLLDVTGRVLSLGRDAAGELYVLTNRELGPFGNTGKVYRLTSRPQ